MNVSADIAIVGSGFAGSLMAMIARRLGRSVVLLERGRHPRFAIGESSTPLANLLLEELATTYDLPRLLPLTKWSTWRRNYPEITCGLKRGFTFYYHRAGQPFEGCADHSDQLLVAASPADVVADTHWYRPDFDAFLVREAESLGVEYLDEFALEAVECHAGVAMIEGARQGHRVTVRARWLIDATGAGGSLGSQLGAGREPFAGFPATQSLFTHFTDVRKCQELIGSASDARLPYPPDAAAVHHVFDGGWVWALRFNNGITSAGVMATDALAAELRLNEGEAAWARLLQRFPTLAALFGGARPTRPFTYMPSVAFRASKIRGPGWTLLPSAAGLVDPLLSTGFPLTLLGIQRLAAIIERHWGAADFETHLDSYAAATLSELDATALLVAALYRAMPGFEQFVPLALLYFAATSFSEMARRLGRGELATGFLLHNHPTFGPAMRRCCLRVNKNGRQTGMSAPPSRQTGVSDLPGRQTGMSSPPRSLLDEVLEAIAPIDIAGLSRADRANWYPVDVNDTLAAAHKLGVSPAAIQEMLHRCGL